jgi:N-glycosylase/DNA lyase
MLKGFLPLPEPFSLGLTLLCGQCFRWEGPNPDGWFQGVAGGAFWRIRQEGKNLFWECSSPVVRHDPAAEWLSRYLNLDEDLTEWLKTMEGNRILQAPLALLRGLRLLRQEPWECTVSYMFAQGLSVVVIRQALHKFCRKYGAPVPDAPGFHDFPMPQDLALLSPDLLRPFTNNYRARADRIIRVARVVEARVINLDHLKEIPCDEAREALMNLEGIGPKIADCILLFALNHSSAFPVDRWVLRAMKKYFNSVNFLGLGREAPAPGKYLQIVTKARKAFSDRCGLASEYMFLYLRLLEDEKLMRELSPFCHFSNRFLRLSPAPRPGKELKKGGSFL